MRFKTTIEAIVELGDGRPSPEDYARAAGLAVQALEKRRRDVTIKVTESGGLGGATMEIPLSRLSKERPR